MRSRARIQRSASEHPGLDLGLVAGLSGPGRDDRHPVVRGHLLIGGVDVGLVAMGPGHPRAEVVAHHDGGDGPEELEGVHMRCHPRRELLG